MLKIGLTGGIGVGKTAVSDCFQKLGVPVIDTDVIAREVVLPGSPALNEIVNIFGKSVLTKENKLDRKLLGEIVFSDAEKRKTLEAILHPKIKNIVLTKIHKLNAPYCVVVVPLLLETDFIELVDEVLVVDAPDKKRVHWIKKRSGQSESDIKAIIAAQTNREARLAAADYVIVNDGSIEELENKVLDLNSHILESLG